MQQATHDVTEGASAVYTATLVDENGDPIDGGDLLTLTLTLRDDATGEVINSRNAQNVLNQNNVTVDSNGLLTWDIQPEDNAVLNSLLKHEVHVVQFTWTWASKTGQREFFLNVENLGRSCAANMVNRLQHRMGYGRRIVELTDDHFCEAIQQALDVFNRYMYREDTGFISQTTEQQKVVKFGDDAETPDPTLLRVVDVSFTRPRDITAATDDPFLLTGRMYAAGQYGRGGVGRMAPMGRDGVSDLLFHKHYQEARERAASTEPDWHWDENRRWLSLYMPAGPYEVTYFLAYPHTVATIPRNYMDLFLKAAEGYARLILADVRGKFGQQVPGPTGGADTDAAEQRNRGDTLIREVEEVLRRLPLQAGVQFG